MATKLVCTIPFGRYAKGDEITDPAEVAAAQETNARHVVAVSIPDPEPAKAAKGKAGDAPDAA